MKLRFDHQSIRLRVRKSDLEQLSKAGLVEETVHFPHGSLVYRLQVSEAAEAVSANIQANTITVSLPTHQAHVWINSEEVGVYTSLALSGEAPLLQILVEKDFPCKHGTKEDNADAFGELSAP